MYSLHCLLHLGVLIMRVVTNQMLEDCLKSRINMNVVLLEDNTYGWSLPFVKEAVDRAIEKDRLENLKHGMDRLFLNKAEWT